MISWAVALRLLLLMRKTVMLSWQGQELEVMPATAAAMAKLRATQGAMQGAMQTRKVDMMPRRRARRRLVGCRVAGVAHAECVLTTCVPLQAEAESSDSDSSDDDDFDLSKCVCCALRVTFHVQCYACLCVFIEPRCFSGSLISSR